MRRVGFIALAVALAACTALPGSSTPASSASVALGGSATLPPLPTATMAPTPRPDTTPTSSPTPSTASVATPAASATSSVTPPLSPLPQRTLGPGAADVAAVLPTEIAGVAYAAVGQTIDVAQDAPGDYCFLVCSGELAAYAKVLGITSGSITEVFGVPVDRTAPDVVSIVAILLPTADPDRLVDAWKRHLASYGQGYARITERAIAGKQVTFLMFQAEPNPMFDRYVYASGGILFVIVGPAADEGTTPAVVAAAVALLP